MGGADPPSSAGLAGPTPPRGQEVPFVRLAIVLHFVRAMAPPLLVVIAYTLIAATVVRWDMARNGEEVRAFGEELYGMYTQLFFEPTEALPSAPIARLVFWVTPIFGVFLIAEGIVKIGSSLLSEEARRNLWVRIMSERMIDHVIVIGLGHVGYRVVESLLKLGQPVVAIERTAADSFLESVRAMKVPVFLGDARRDELLVEAGIDRARAIVCSTDDDLANLEVALDAKRMNPKVRVVMRMFDQRLASKVGGALELDETFSTSALSAPLVALQATQGGVRGVYETGSGDVRVTVELEAGPRFKQKTIFDIEDAADARVITVRPKGETDAARAKGDTEVTAGDILLFDVSVGALDRLRALLR
ncbi:MAG: TrkA family potassium uptake protein [Polyangiaceae bacterium]|nr:TrkA family potassium uptake protein [Polyangiaceae bacterium]